MNAESLQTISQVLILVGAVGAFGHFYFGKQIEHERRAAEQVQAREAFLKSLHFRGLEAYWVEIAPETYQLGLLAHVLNKDATRALVFEGVQFQGEFALGGSGGAILKSIASYNAQATVQGQYYLSPGKETSIALLLPTKVRMQIIGGTPGLQLKGAWTFTFEGTAFPLNPPSVSVVAVVSQDQWNRGPHAPPPPLATPQFPFPRQLAEAKKRIRYLAYDFAQLPDLTLTIVRGSYGDNSIDSPEMYDWPRVLAQLETEGYITITERRPNDIAFRVTKSADQWK